LGCTPKASPELNLVVAASVGPAANALAQKLDAKGVKVRVHAGASSLIARQIVGGLPCDAVILADDDWMDELAKKNAIDSDSRRPFLGNELVWVTPKGSKAQTDRKIALADPEHVPAGKYAKAALIALGEWNEVAPKVMAAPDVRTALLWAERAEVDSAIIYASDARSSTRVEIRSRLKSEKPIIYPIAACRSPNAAKLAALLNESMSSEVFREFGFHVHERT
jgi:molybdate transport system substrate-binding protein